MLHFLILGGLVFGGERLLTPLLDVPSVSTAPAEADTLSPEDMLVREAIAAGFHQTDALVRDRLVRLGESVASEDVEDPEALEKEARRLGLDHTDPVVRRRLAHAMELTLSRLSPSHWPDEAEARAYYERNRERYMQPGRVRFRHVYFARDRQGTASESAAAQALAVLRAGDETAAASVHGDAFMLGSELNVSSPNVPRRFGAEFAVAVDGATVGQWTGPIASAYGWHLVFVEERTAPALSSFDDVRGRVIHELLTERRAKLLEERLAERRKSYR
jgi:parvulin-like peptidyl-prolyl isomerase